MKRLFAMATLIASFFMLAAPVGAEEAKKPSRWFEREITIQHMRPMDQRGLNMFEAPKTTDIPYTGFKLDWNAAFSASFQALEHKNKALPNVVSGVNLNELMNLGPGFNTPNANLYLNSQLADGIRLQLSLYLSSRHHNETWVKDGYLLIDKLPFSTPYTDLLMDMATLKLGHFEINYGDAHFRRSDNGMSLYNPFVSNLILDAFTTEIGGEFYLRPQGMLEGAMVMVGVTSGEIKGDVVTSATASRQPSYLGKIGYETDLAENLHVRLTGSHYRNESSPANTLYTGDRAGSRYFVMENVKSVISTTKSGGLNPEFTNRVSAWQVNPFVKFHGLELFGVVEFASGKNAVEKSNRDIRQYAVDAVYRFLADESAYIAARYNRVTGELIPDVDDGAINRYSVGGGYFLTRNALIKAEYVWQDYDGFAPKDLRHDGSFKGFVVETAVAF